MTRCVCLTIAAAALALTACGGRDPVDERAENTAGLPVSTRTTPSATGAPPPTADPATQAGDPTASARIPAALHGRWALAPNDCTSTRGDAKGLLVISGDELRFYESVAVPGDGVQTDPDSISGEFDFTGEGQTWTRYEVLELRDRNLVRTESNPSASFSYVKCS
jgi:hypothetical protein